jgi:23S rRNA (adenine2503-C2)-methyltransferase
LAAVAELPSLTALSREELAAWLRQRGEPSYRVGQVWRRLAAGDAIEEMTGLPRALRADLTAAFRSRSLTELRRLTADQGLTTKLLYRLDGGHTVEAVIMRYPRRSTLCISSQVGCPIGCPFCATGQGPFGRNLHTHEIWEQAVAAGRLLRAEGRRLTHVVFMGMGEPLANYASVVAAVRRLADPDGLGVSPRRITVSTAGLVPRIDRLAREGLAVTLAVSLHAARDDLRDQLVPINRRYPIAELVKAADRYAARTGRRVSYEWVMLAGVNDTERDALELARLLRGRLAHLNLIPFNPVPKAPYREPSPTRVQGFAARLRSLGLGVTVRDTRGREQDAACGQLRARVLAELERGGALAALRSG